MIGWSNSEPVTLLRFPERFFLRALEVLRYLEIYPRKGVVVFTCGEQVSELHKTGLYVLDIGPTGKLKTDKWWTQEEIAATFPDLFDVTSGHLPSVLLTALARAYRLYLGDLKPGQYAVPTGSGETILLLHLAYPQLKFCAVYDNNNPATTRDPQGTLNAEVDKTFSTQYWHGLL